MKQRIMQLSGAAVIAGAALLLAGCGSDDAPSATTDEAAAITASSVDGHQVLVDSDGRTLYTAAVEQSGIRCVDTCVQFWEPVFSASTDVQAAAADLRSELGTVERPDGSSQVTYQDLPLYTFTQEEAGQVSGDGFTDDFQGTHFEWSAASPEGSGTSTGTSDSSGPGGYDY